MKKLNITPGKAEVKDHASYVGYANIPLSMGEESSLIAEDDATLYADAHNTYHATGMLPSEMAERIKALEEGLRNIVASWDERGTEREVLKEAVIGPPGTFWSPAASMVSSEHIAHARALLNPINEAHASIITKPE